MFYNNSSFSNRKSELKTRLINICKHNYLWHVTNSFQENFISLGQVSSHPKNTPALSQNSKEQYSRMTHFPLKTSFCKNNSGNNNISMPQQSYVRALNSQLCFRWIFKISYCSCSQLSKYN